jgi:hypothetical protein
MLLLLLLLDLFLSNAQNSFGKGFLSELGKGFLISQIKFKLRHSCLAEMAGFEVRLRLMLGVWLLLLLSVMSQYSEAPAGSENVSKELKLTSQRNATESSWVSLRELSASHFTDDRLSFLYSDASSEAYWILLYAWLAGFA